MNKNTAKIEGFHYLSIFHEFRKVKVIGLLQKNGVLLQFILNNDAQSR